MSVKKEGSWFFENCVDQQNFIKFSNGKRGGGGSNVELEILAGQGTSKR